MKKTFLILLCLSMSYYLMAQDVVKQKEIGLVFSNLDNFGLTFKTGTDKSLWRFKTLFISGNDTEESSDSYSNKHNSMGFGAAVGKEFRKGIIKNLELRYGADLSFTFNKMKSDFDDKSIGDNDRVIEQTTFKPGVNLVFGLNYILKDNLVFGAELLPGFSYTTGKRTDSQIYEDKSDISGFSYGLSNTSVLLSVVYRF